MRVNAAVAALACACAALAQEQAPFAVAGWSNLHEQDFGTIATTWFGEAVRSKARGLSSFVSRPADHCADGAGEDGAGVSREDVAFPLVIWGPPEGAWFPAFTLPKDFDLAFEPLPCAAPTLLRRAVERSVLVAVLRDGVGNIVSIGDRRPGGEEPALPEPDPAFLAGWHASLCDRSREELPSPLREVAAHSEAIGVVVGLRARLDDVWFDQDGKPERRIVDEIEGAVAADGRFRLVARGEYATEDEGVASVAIELCCDLRAVYLGVREWPTRCVWPRDHARIHDVLRTDARAALPLIAWARDPYWFAPCSRLAHAVDQDGEFTRVDETAPDEGLPGIARHLVDEQCDPPRVQRLQVLAGEGSLVLEHRYADERELAPGYRRPMTITSRWWSPGASTLVRERTLTILAARVGAESSVPSWRPGVEVTDWRVQR